MARSGLALILAAYLALAAGFAAVTPFGKAPDETAHALYVEHLVRQRSLPVLRQERREAYEFHQPPLYYALAAPAWAVGAIASPRAANMAARGVSILIGAVGIWLIWVLARTGWPDWQALALAAAGFAAVLPMRLATAASVSNDTLTEAVFTGTLVVIAWMLRRGPTPRLAAVLGVCLGLGVLTKSSAILLFPLALVALLLACRAIAAAPEPSAGRGGRKVKAEVARSDLDGPLLLRCAAIAFGLALLIGGGWMARNAVLYGDPLGTKAFEQYFQDTPTPDRLSQALGYTRLELWTRKVLPLTFCSFWGVFGHMNLFMGEYPPKTDAPGWTYLLADGRYPPPSWLYPLLLLPTLIALAGLVKVGVGRWVLGVGRSDRSDRSEHRTPNTQHPTPNTQRPTPDRLAAVLILAWFLVVAAFLRFNTEFFQAQGRYLFPAMGPIALGFAGGWLAWGRRRLWLAVALLCGMLALAVYALFGTLVPASWG